MGYSWDAEPASSEEVSPSPAPNPRNGETTLIEGSSGPDIYYSYGALEKHPLSNAE
jgi:hypothetical protein